MSFRLSLLTFFLFAAFGGLRPNLAATVDGGSSTMPNAGSTIIAYWQTMLPRSTMPSAIRDLLTTNNAESKGDQEKNLNTAIFHDKEAKGHKLYLPISVSYEKEAKNLNPTILQEKEAKRDNLHVPISVSYGKEANDLNPQIFHGNEAKGDNVYLPISVSYEEEVKNLNPAIVDGKEETGDNLYLPISVSYWQEGNNIKQAIFHEKEANGAHLHVSISISYGKEANNLNPAIVHEEGTNGPVHKSKMNIAEKRDNLFLPISVSYGKEENNLNPAILHWNEGKGDNLHLPISVSYGKEANNLGPAIFHDKEPTGDNLHVPISISYGKGVNNLEPALIHVADAKGDNLYEPISISYGNGVNNLHPAIIQGEGTIRPVDVSMTNMADAKGDNLYQPISVSYGKAANKINPLIIKEEGTNGPVHVSMTNMADADHHVHEHRHINGGHHHLNLRNAGFLFLEDTLTPGSKVAPYIDPASCLAAPLLPRDVADAIPMSIKSYTDILRMFAPVSRAMANGIWYSLELCEHPRPIKGEKRGCVTSIESMVDFAASMLGTSDLRAFSSPSIPVEGCIASKVYTVLAVREITSPGDTMTCHVIPFPYKVFLCHALVPTKVYSVMIGGDNEEEMIEGLVVCHLNTAEFDPVMLPAGVKPGDAPVCHFLNKDDILWAPAATTVGTQGAPDVVVAAQ